MEFNLSGRTALVTGSTAGIGLAIATGLADAGAHVVVNGRGRARTDAAVAAIGGAVPLAKLRGIATDVGTAGGCAALVAALPAVDILINNAGVFTPMDFFDTPDEEWERHWQVNTMSGVRLSRAYLPGMMRAGWGRVIFIASESAFNVPVEMIHYGVSKIADVAVARGLAKRAAGSGVTVNSVLPGPTMSEGMQAMLGGADGEALERIGREAVAAGRPSSIIRRMATAEEVANLVVYVASPLASATTGAALRVDGGVVDSL